MGKRGLLVALGASAAGAVLWWMAVGSQPDKPIPSSSAPASDSAIAPAAALAEPGTPGLDTAKEVRRAVEGGVLPVTTAPQDGPLGEGSLVVQVLRSDTGEPAPEERIYLRRDGDKGMIESLQGSIGGFNHALRADEGGRCTFIISAGVPARVGSMRALGREDNELLVEPLVVGETRQLTLVMPVFEHWLRVVSANDGFALAGARVRTEEGDQDVSTGSDGLARLWCSEWRDEKVGVEAERFGPALIKLQRGHETPASALVVRLLPGACLRGKVVDAANEPILNAWVRVVSGGWDLMRAEPVNMVDGGFSTTLYEDRTWSARTDASGAFTLCGLPSSIPLRVTVSKGARLRLSLPEPIQLAPGEERPVVYCLGAGAIVRGTVHDESGRPVPRCNLWLKGAADCKDFPRPLPAAERYLRSDGEGRFEIQHVADGEWCLGPAPTSGYLPIPTIVQVQRGLSIGEAVVEARTGYFIEGHVIGPGGGAVSGVCVQSHGWAMDWTNDHGAFRIGPFPPGPVTLNVTDKDLAALEPFHVQAGQEDIVLRLSHEPHRRRSAIR